MEPKRSKYDTNPLDENVADHATKAWGRDTGERPDAPTQNVSGAATRAIGGDAHEDARRSPETEAPTRRMDDSYPSVFAYGHSNQATYQSPYQAPQPVANIYQPPPSPPPQIYQPPLPTARPGSRKIPGLGLQEKWAVILPYLPIGFVIAIIAAVVELYFVPRNETRVRFHAAQGLGLQIFVGAIGMLLTFAGLLLSDRFTGAGLFRFAAFVFLVISMFRVWKGKPHHITLLDPVTNWFNEKIGPRK
jgi:uncharacterized membrane protein